MAVKRVSKNKKGKLKITTKEQKADYQSLQEVSNPNDIHLSESMDRFTMNIAIICITYFVAWLFMYGVTLIIDAGYLGNFGTNTLKPLVWGLTSCSARFLLSLRSDYESFQKDWLYEEGVHQQLYA